MRFFPHDQLKDICNKLLTSVGIQKPIAYEVAECLIQTSLRGVDSHGIRLLPHYIRVAESGRINKKANYSFNQTSPTSGIYDADHTYGHAAASFAMKEAIKMANNSGSGFVVVKKSTHFSASAYYALQASDQDMIGFSSTSTSSTMVPTRGKNPFLGTNAITFSFPCEGEDPVCLDMATTQIAWNWVLKARAEGKKLDSPWAINKEGFPTDDPNKAIGLLPAGLHKGYGLGLVVEILCNILANQPYGKNVSDMFDGDLSEKRFLSHFVGAIKISNFIDIKLFKSSLKNMITEIRNEPPIDSDHPILVAGDPEKISEKERLVNGIPIEIEIINEINEIIDHQGLSKILKL